MQKTSDELLTQSGNGIAHDRKIILQTRSTPEKIEALLQLLSYADKIVFYKSQMGILHGDDAALASALLRTKLNRPMEHRCDKLFIRYLSYADVLAFVESLNA